MPRCVDIVECAHIIGRQRSSCMVFVWVCETTATEEFQDQLSAERGQQQEALASSRSKTFGIPHGGYLHALSLLVRTVTISFEGSRTDTKP